MRGRAAERPTDPLELFGAVPAAAPEREVARGDRVVLERKLDGLRADVRILTAVAVIALLVAVLR